jgi:hypothetical protein
LEAPSDLMVINVLDSPTSDLSTVEPILEASSNLTVSSALGEVKYPAYIFQYTMARLACFITALACL